MNLNMLERCSKKRSESTKGTDSSMRKLDSLRSKSSKTKEIHLNSKERPIFSNLSSKEIHLKKQGSSKRPLSPITKD